jgi:hypothetical protein
MPRKIFILFLSISLLFTAVLAAGEFTADLSITGLQVDTKAKFCVKANLYRLDAPQGESSVALIHKKGATWMINPELKQFRKLSPAEEAFMNPFAAWENMSYDMMAENVGAQTIKGFKCQKYDYKYKGETKVVLERWLADDLKFVIKQVFHADNGDAVIELDNIKIGPLDDALFEIPSTYTELKDTPKAEAPKAAGVTHAITTSETGEAPWGRRYGPGGKVTIAMNTDFDPKLTLVNDSEGEAVCTFTTVKKGEESAPMTVSLKVKGKKEEPFIGFKGIESISVKVEKGEIFVIASQKADSFSDKAYAEDRVLRTTAEYSDVGQGFIVKPDKKLIITITADSQDDPGAKGSFKVYKGSYSDLIEEVTIDMKNGESKTWEYPAAKAAQSWEILLKQGAVRYSYEQQ